MRNLLIISLLCFICSPVFGQIRGNVKKKPQTYSQKTPTKKRAKRGIDRSKLRAGLGADLALFIGDGGGVGLGGTARVEYSLNNQLTVTATTGFIPYLNKFEGGLIPLQAGLKFYFQKNIYALGQAGLHIYTGGDGATRVSLGAGAGYEIPLQRGMTLDLGARFQLIDGLNYLGFRGGILFPLSR